jgi:deazaflavin-dependent oxidoreductase (nitroreductase family)
MPVKFGSTLGPRKSTTGRLVLPVGSNGAPTHPDWYHNLRATSQVTVEVGNERFDAHARVATDDERVRLWRERKKEIPVLADYEQKTSRQIPVVVLEPA